MATLGDAKRVIFKIGPIELARRVWREINDDHLFVFGSALAYSWLFAFFPLFVFLLSLVSYLPAGSIDETRGHIQTFLTAILPNETADVVWTTIQSRLTTGVDRPLFGMLSISLVLALWASSGGITATMSALDKCYEVEKGRSWLHRRPMAVGLTLMVVALVLTVLAMLPFGAVVRQWMLINLDDLITVWAVPLYDVVRWSIGIAAAFLMLSVIYHFGPSIKHRWVVFSPGAVFCFAAWIFLALGVKVFLSANKGNFVNYGVLAHAVVLLLVFYLDAVVLLIGAEINSEIDFEALGVPRGARDFRVRPRLSETAAALVGENQTAPAGQIQTAPPDGNPAAAAALAPAQATQPPAHAPLPPAPSTQPPAPSTLPPAPAASGRLRGSDSP